MSREERLFTEGNTEMRLKAVSGIMLTLLLIGMLNWPFNIQRIHSSEPPPIEWSRTYEGVGYSLVKTSDGGYAWAGHTGNFMEDDVDGLLVKVDSSGNMQWNKTYRRNMWNVAYSLVETSDGGYALAGYTGEMTWCGFWLVKVDSSGNMEWNRELWGDQFDTAFSLVETSDGGYALAGTSGNAEGGNRFRLVKVDSSGNTEWNQEYGGTCGDFAHSMVQTDDGGYAIAGYTYSCDTGYSDFLLVKTDSYGNMEWNQTYGETSDDRGQSVVQTSDGGYAIAGYTYSCDTGYSDFWLVKTDSYGNMEWNQTYGETGGDSARCVVQTGDGGYAIAGCGFANLVKTDSSGNLLWSKNYGGDLCFSSMVESSDGGYALAGNKDGNFWLVKTSGAPTHILASADAYMRSDMAQFNFGSDEGLIVGRFPVGDGTVLNLMRSLITFDLPSIPSGAVVTSAKLYMYIDGIGYADGALPRSFGAYRITSNWVEGDGAAPSPSLTGATWNNQPSFLNTPTSTVVIYPGVAGTWVNWDITTDVQNGYANPSAWHGILIQDEHEDPPTHAYVHFYSREQTHIPYLPFRPYLSITYEVIDHVCIYIRADGSVDPPSAPISTVDNVTYTFTSNFTGSIVVERNNTILDGYGYTLSTESEKYVDALTLSNVCNVTIKNMDISAHWDAHACIQLSNSSFNTVSENDLTTYDGYCIYLSNSPNNMIFGNNMSCGDSRAIWLSSSAFNSISENNISISYSWGISLHLSSFNNIMRNNIKGWEEDTGIRLSSSSFNNVHENYLECYAGGTAIALGASLNNTISGNTCHAGSDGIRLGSSSNNTICNNNVEGYYGIRLSSSSNNNTIHRNNVADWDGGSIVLDTSSYNNISRNTCWGGTRLESSSNNKFYHNNFLSDDAGVESINSTNVWDDGYPSGGNYWIDYVGVDEYTGANQDEPGHDGFGDTPYIIDQHNQDNYPFLRPCPQPPWIPISSFVYAPSAPVVDETVTFNASASYDVDGQIVSYHWDFGDQTNITKNDAVTTHSYMLPGTYAVTLNITDNDGLTDVTTKSIDIGKIPTSITVSTSSPSTYVGFKVNITGTLQDMYGTGLAGEAVVLYYTFGGITTWTPITSDTTDNLGNYFAMWIPPATGYFEVKGEWGGNSTHFGTSNTATLSSLVYQDQYVFSVESNSTISELAFDTKNWKLSFTATGPDGTTGYTKVTVAKSLVADIANIRVFMDGRQLEYLITSLDDSWLLTFTYTHSTHQVEVDLGTAETDTTPPAISILSPENKTYALKDVPLTFTVNETTSWIGYSLDGQANTTITGNATLTSLLDGSHSVVVYANDTAGNMGASSMVYFTVDTTPPNITDVSQIPIEENVQPEDEVIVNATVIDVVGGVERVALNYTNGNGTWVIIEMTSLSVQANVWGAIIPSFPYGTNVTYVILAEDNAGHTVTSEELGYEYQYQVIPEFPSFLILPLFMIATLLAVIVYRRKESM